jgi:hypothetical protein
MVKSVSCRTFGNRAGHGFLVEGPQVFDRAAAAREQNHVHGLPAVEIFERRGDLLRRALALHTHGINDQVQIGEAPPQDADDIAHRRASGRSHDADAAGQQRQRHLAPGIKKPFGVEALLELLESQLQRAHSRRLEVLDVNLVLAARLIHADRSAHDQLEPVLGPEL